jgi:hypothetical protein
LDMDFLRPQSLVGRGPFTNVDAQVTSHLDVFLYYHGDNH